MILANKTKDQKKIIGIPLFGKGATNHLHRQEIIDEFERKGWRVVFWIRSDYMDIIEQLLGCSYKVFQELPQNNDWKQSLLDFCKHLRYQYPSCDLWRHWQYKTLNQMTSRLTTRLFRSFVYHLAKFRIVMIGATAIEGWIWRKRIKCSFLMDEKDFNCLLLLGIGAAFDEMGPAVTWWAYKDGIPIIHFIANYDNLSSKGFRAHPVKKLLVWGNQMGEDAVKLHGMPQQRVKEIGALRYNMIPPNATRSKEDFLRMSELDSDAKTVMFAGSAYDFHYFEMLEAFDELKSCSVDRLQLVIRVYPNRYLLNVAYMRTFLKYVETRKDVWISIGDPNYNIKHSDQDVIKIEENELWYILQFCDVVINIFSTLTIEACIFDKPVINMWYFPKVARALKQPIYYPYPLTQHIRRIMKSEAVDLAENRSQLLDLIENALRNPEKRQTQRKKLVDIECGLIDGNAVERLVLNCIN